MSPYRFAGAPLSPTVFGEVAVDVVPRNRTFSRTEIIDMVTATHLEGGGKAITTSMTSTAKKALQDLSAAGLVRNIAYGHWRFDEAMSPDRVREPVEIGNGKEAVYVYYFPAYRDQAAHLGRVDWPMKIGMTASDVTARIKAQISTAMPETPAIGLIYRTDTATNDEWLLHSTLRARGRHLSTAPGQEWYMTSLVEIREILDFAVGGHSVTSASGSGSGADSPV